MHVVYIYSSRKKLHKEPVKIQAPRAQQVSNGARGPVWFVVAQVVQKF